ncbi:hypothetical protein JHV666_27380 [Mycobacterium avium subsp. hominissuis]
MTTLLEFLLKHFDFLYLDPRYRITDSSTTGVATSGASLTLSGPTTSWHISNDRGNIAFSVAPTALASESQNWFRLSIIRQYLDNYDEMNAVAPTEAAAWARQNRARIDDLFSNGSVLESCEALTAL